MLESLKMEFVLALEAKKIPKNSSNITLFIVVVLSNLGLAI